MNILAEPRGSTARTGVGRAALMTFLATAIALKIGFLFLFAWRSRFVMDEFVQLGWAKYLGNGLFDTIWHAKAVGYVVFYKIAHIIGWDATSILLIGRLQTALLACATLAIVYGSARALGHDRIRSLAIILVLLCFSNFIERSFRTIAEPLAVFFAAAALLVLLRGRPDRAATVITTGILSGLSFLVTQKALYFDVALGVALIADAALTRRYRAGIVRAALLFLGWSLPVIAYCFIFGGGDPARVAMHLAFGPLEVATTGANAYANLRQYVWQTLARNLILYIFCVGGMVLELLRIGKLDERRRIALIFTIVVATFVFAHNQPWPYVFIMALPFMALWSLTLLDRLRDNPARLRLGGIALMTAVPVSLASNIRYLSNDNVTQLDLIARAEALVAPDERYFDGIGMLPNRQEPSTLWLDRRMIQATLREGRRSEAYQLLTRSPPKIILWSYRMDDIWSIVAPAIQDSYVTIGPNLRIAGRQLYNGKPATFIVPIAGEYELYDAVGRPVTAQVEVDGLTVTPPIRLPPGTTTVILKDRAHALLLPRGSYRGKLRRGPDNPLLFANVYD